MVSGKTATLITCYELPTWWWKVHSWQSAGKQHWGCDDRQFCHLWEMIVHLCTVATFLCNLGPSYAFLFLLTWTGSCDSVVMCPRSIMSKAAPLCGFLVCPTPCSHSSKHPIKREQCIQFVVPCFPCFCAYVLLYISYHWWGRRKTCTVAYV